jgi:SAM-dependent methyltransferase
MSELDLLRHLPRSRRNVNARVTAKSPDVIATAKQYGAEYFDGPREYGYGGYRYDGRWLPVAADIVSHFALKPGQRVLDVGCAKGFLVKDLMTARPGLEAFGLDISEYALLHCEPEIVGRLHLGSCERLPFPDASFDAVLCINTLHNRNREGVIRSLKEIERLAPGRSFVQVDSYRDPEQRRMFMDWVLTAEFHGYPDEWRAVFQEAGYTGDYYWTIVE